MDGLLSPRSDLNLAVSSSVSSRRDCLQGGGTNISYHRNGAEQLPRDTMGWACLFDGGKMSGADLERLRRQKVLKDLNSRLATGIKAGLSITGHKIPIQGILYYCMSEVAV